MLHLAIGLFVSEEATLGQAAEVGCRQVRDAVVSALPRIAGLDEILALRDAFEPSPHFSPRKQTWQSVTHRAHWKCGLNGYRSSESVLTTRNSKD
jgi:hypothetical protein